MIAYSLPHLSPPLKHGVRQPLDVVSELTPTLLLLLPSAQKTAASTSGQHSTWAVGIGLRLSVNGRIPTFNPRFLISPSENSAQLLCLKAPTGFKVPTRFAAAFQKKITFPRLSTLPIFRCHLDCSAAL